MTPGISVGFTFLVPDRALLFSGSDLVRVSSKGALCFGFGHGKDSDSLTRGRSSGQVLIDSTWQSFAIVEARCL